jgi:hypothetical protein
VVDEPAAEASAAAAENAPTAEQKPKYARPPVVGDRRKPRGVNPELEMLGRLGTQAQGILRLALTVEGDETLRHFTDYLAFREKISEFEAFCNVIESHLKDMVSERRQELEDRFYSLWAMIFRPSLRALTRFFDRLVEEGILPLGGRDLLDSEMRALASMRSVLAAPRFANIADKTMLDELSQLEAMIGKLAERATSLPDFSRRPAVNAKNLVPPETLPADEEAPPAPPRVAPPAPAAPAAAPRPDLAALGDTPNVKAVRELKALLEYYKRDKSLRQYVDIDTRAVDEIERKLVVNAMDPAAVVWMRQICNAWASRLRDNDKDIRRVLSMIRSG